MPRRTVRIASARLPRPRSWRSRALALAASALCATLLPAVASAAEPTPFATASVSCSQGELATLSFPPQSSAYPEAILHFQSIGGEGFFADEHLESTWFGSGDSGWIGYGEVQAGTAPTVDVECGPSSGSIEAALASRPRTPATFTGRSTAGGGGGVDDRSSYLPFIAPGAGQYAVDLTISQGAISIEGVPGILESGGEYALGNLPAGDRNLGITAESGPTAIWTATVRELPVAVNKLTFGQTCIAAGAGLPATFSTTGETHITATVLNAAGQVVRNLGAFDVKEGASSIPWDGRGEGGATLPGGTYTLDLVSTDPQGESTSAQASIYLAGGGPTVSMTSPAKITPSQQVAFQVSDAACGVASAQVTIDGEDAGTYGKDASGEEEEEEGAGDNARLPADGALVLSPRTAWPHGTNHWTIEATDEVGDTSTTKGTFTVPSRAKETKCVVPRVVGQTLPSARKSIGKADCRVGKITYKRRRQIRRDYVLSQSPHAGTHRAARSKVQLVVNR